MDKKSKCKIQVWWGIPAFSRQTCHLYSILRAEIINIIKDLVTKEPNKKFFLEYIVGKDCMEGEREMKIGPKSPRTALFLSSKLAIRYNQGLCGSETKPCITQMEVFA